MNIGIKTYASAALAILLAASCAKEEAVSPVPGANGQKQPEITMTDCSVVLFDDRTVSLLEEAAAGGKIMTKSMDLNNIIDELGVVSYERVFPDAGPYEGRTRREGLHKWYMVKYSDAVQVTKAETALNSLPGVVTVERPRKIRRLALPDDPNFKWQWNMYNDKSLNLTIRSGARILSSNEGCDINVKDIWEAYTTGNPSVIVSVVDEGIDLEHEDLKANCIPAGENGSRNFATDNEKNFYKVTPGDHGTHVGGVISAIRNNGIGVAGIAGGDYAAGKGGVRLMSCQIFEDPNENLGNSYYNSEAYAYSTANAIKWGADHGAVISQNSWGSIYPGTTSSALKAAVDYFTDNAGYDERGNQTGPMKGGVVIFAAGNEDAAVSGNDYGPIINVASVGADYRRAYYSNYGSWVDIAAPGGNVRSGNQVFSTLPGNKYGNMQGTSMACPHVSGVAALVLSYMYSRTPSGYTADALTKKLLNYTTSISSFNPNYSLGRGLVNAYRSVAGSSGGKAPKTPTDFAVNEVKANNVSVSVTVPVDEDDGAPVAIRFYYSKSDFTRVSDNLMYGALYVGDLNPGETLTCVFSGMDFGADYYVAAVAVDGLGNQSGLTSRIQVHTGPNSAPVITDLNSPRTSVSPHETISFDTEVVDPDGHYYAIELESHFEHPELDDKGVEIQPAVLLDTTVRNKPKIVAAGRVLASGKYTARMTVTDYFGASAVKDVAFEILPNSIPYKGKDMEDRIFTSRTAGTLELDCKEYFKDDDGEDLAYTIAISNETVVNMTASGGKFLLTPMNYGYSDITVTGTDVRGEQVTQTFSILVRDGSRELDVYPNPVRDDLFLRTGDETSLDIRVISASGAVFYSGSQEVTPFSPAVVDMRGAFPGSYTVMVGFSGKTVKASVVKL